MAEPLSSLGVIGGPLLMLVLASAIVMGSPGPSTMSVTAVGAAFGLRRSLNYLAGLVLGTIAVLCTVATGVVAVLLSVPQLSSLLIVASALYILYLAFKIATAPPLSAPGRETAAPSLAGGFLLAIANPKAYLAIAAVFASTTVIADGRTADALVKTLVLAAMILIIHLGWLLAGAALSRLLRDPVASRVANIIFAATLVLMTAFAAIR
jgi:threonine/homoserine/homoserine lactone efflux protein